MKNNTKQNRTEQINISISPDERKKIELASDKTGRCLSNFGRISMIKLAEKVLNENGNTTNSSSD